MNLSPADKVRLLRELTDGAPDVFACWAKGSRVGRTRWRPIYSPVTDHALRLHLGGDIEVGSYPLIPADPWPLCKWVCADFDGKKELTDWKADVKRLMPFLLDFDLTVFVNLSRSGNGAHVRLLFAEPVPAWMARRWMNTWLREAGVVVDDEWDRETPSSFDRTIPPQDRLKQGLNKEGNRYPGNLAGSPLHRVHAQHGGTLPLDPERVAAGDFEPDGRHWQHVAAALDSRSWGAEDLRAAMVDEDISVEEPSAAGGFMSADGEYRSLPVVAGTDAQLQMTVDFCKFFLHMRACGRQSYHLWVALASQLHRFGDEGKRVFHEISSCDPRYDASQAERKWRDTADMMPVRCDTIAQLGWTCPHLNDLRCNNPRSPSYFTRNLYAELCPDLLDDDPAS